eukprot:XP_015577216.1 serine/threonine-protein kinase CDG1 isoform X1 [Ricinus communis]
MVRKRRESKQTAIVVLEGIKVSTEHTGIAPLCKAVHEVANPDDEIIVLTLLSVRNTSEPSSSNTGAVGGANVRQWNQSREADSYIRLLREEISQRKENYLRIFRPFYYSCKSNGVKFQVKIAAGFRPKDIIIEEANNVRPTWIVMDRCFARHLTFRMSGTDCHVSLVSDDEQLMVHNCLPSNDAPKNSSAGDVARNPKFPKLRKGSISAEVAQFPDSLPTVSNECQPILSSLPAIMCKESENQTFSEPSRNSESCLGAISQETSHVQQEKQDTISEKVDIFLRQPLQLTWEVIMEITQEFKSRICDGQSGNYMSYYGYLENHQSLVLVKRYKGDSVSILEAQMKAALFLHHKNILTLIGYYRSEQDVVLVFPFKIEGTLDKHLCDLTRKQWDLTFQDKMRIAIGIAQGIRYMHEECPRGPIAHGKLLSSNIFLTSDLQPMIAGFEHATWLQLKQESPAFNDRYQFGNCLDHGSTVLLKSDIFAFGVLLLRLFCKRSVPQDDKILIDWASPLLLDRAFHLLLDEDSGLDMHEVFRVMSAARMCTMSKPVSRPSITEVKIFASYNHHHQTTVHKVDGISSLEVAAKIAGWVTTPKGPLDSP